MKASFEKEDYTDIARADIEFHKYLVEKAGGDELVNLWYLVVRRMRMNYKRIDTPIAGVSEHHAIVDAPHRQRPIHPPSTIRMVPLT